MLLYEVILIGVALAIDACALTISNCATYKNSLNRKRELAMPITFGFFQGVMPLIGYYIGSLFKDLLGEALKFLSATIFLFLAIKIVVDILKEKREECSIKEGQKVCSKTDFTCGVLLLQAVATSIDALVIGVTLVNLAFSVFIAVILIALITFILAFICLFIGKKLGAIFGEYAEWIGVIILFGLSIKGFIEAFI